MSGAISFVGGGDPALTQVIVGASHIKKNFDTLTEQASSGYISTTYDGLGGTAPTALALGPQISALTAAQANISAASGPAQITQTTMTQIQSIASGLMANMPNLNNLNSTEIDTISAQAQSDLTQVANLLDTQYGGVYVFAGQDSSNPPVPNPNQILSSGFFTQIQAAVSTMSTNGAAATTAATLAVASSNASGTSPFSSYMSQPSTSISPPSVSTGNGQSQTIGLMAGANTNAVSTGTSTTGSYMRDLMRALATVGSLSSSQASDPNFASVIADTQTSVTNMVTAMSTDVGVLGEQQANLTTMGTNMSDTSTALTGQLTTAQNVDMATTLSDLSLTQTQLQASYQLLSASSGMSLVKYLAAGA